MKRMATWAIVIGVAGLGALGCNNRVEQCNKLIDRVNNATKSFDSMGAAMGADPEKGMADAAKKMDDAKKDVAATDLKDEKLKGFRDRYAAIMGKGADVLKSLEEGIHKKDMSVLQKAQNDYKDADKEEDTLKDEIMKYCKE